MMRRDKYPGMHVMFAMIGFASAILGLMSACGCSTKSDSKTAAVRAAAEPSKPRAGATGTKPEAPYGWTLQNGKLVPAPPPKEAAPSLAPAPSVPTAATGDLAKDWALEYERTENGPEADLVVRTGDISNLGFGWPKDFDPFSGKSTYPHSFPWSPRPG